MSKVVVNQTTDANGTVTYEFADGTTLSIPNPLKGLEAQINVLQTQVADLLSRTESLEVGLASSDGNIVSLQDSVTSLQATISSLQTQASDFESRISALENP